MKKYLLIGFQFVLILVLFSCKSDKINYPEKPAIYGLATTILIEKGQTDVLLSDYFNNPSEIDSVTTEKKSKETQEKETQGIASLQLKLDKDKKNLIITPTDVNKIPLFAEIKFWIKGFPYSIPARKSMKITKKFTYNPSGQKYSSVQLAGDFNSWNPANTNLQLKDGVWQTELDLNPGRYSYQVVADGKWMLDPDNPEKADNNIGGVNSVLIVKSEGSEKAPVLYTDNYRVRRLSIGFENAPEEFYIFWENYRLEAGSWKVEAGGQKSEIGKNDNRKDTKTQRGIIEIKIPVDAVKRERSYVRVWAVNKYGVSNDIMIPLMNGRVIKNPAHIRRSDKQAMILYFLMVDRFNNGNRKNDSTVKDPQVDRKANYFGGDIAGITQKLKDGYFETLGINSIWISPISQNPYEAYVEYPAPHRKYSGYHGYWPISSINIDTRFGTPDEMKELVTEAHSRGINIIMDYVSHHVHKDHPLYKLHPDWITQLDLPGGRKNIRIWDEQRLTTWFDTFLPTLDFNRPQVVEMEADSAIYWVQNYDIDGFRHDATKHVPEVFWRRLTQKIKELEVQSSELGENKTTKTTKSIYQIGETFGSRELIASYINSGELDAQFDFNLYFDARTVFAIDKEPFSKLRNSLQESFDYYGTHNLMGNITGNHDIPRFISLASGALAFNEDDKEAGWKRDIEVKDPVGYKKLSMLTAFIMTIPGVPVIYYGDEIGMPGAGDPDNRRPMKFTDLNNDEAKVKETAEKLIKLRRENIPLMYGDTKFFVSADKAMVYARTYFNDIAIIAFNKDSSPAQIRFNIPERFAKVNLIGNFDTSWSREVAGNVSTITIELPAYSFEVLSNKRGTGIGNYK